MYHYARASVYFQHLKISKSWEFHAYAPTRHPDSILSTKSLLSLNLILDPTKASRSAWFHLLCADGSSTLCHFHTIGGCSLHLRHLTSLPPSQRPSLVEVLIPLICPTVWILPFVGGHLCEWCWQICPSKENGERSQQRTKIDGRSQRVDWACQTTLYTKVI